MYKEAAAPPMPAERLPDTLDPYALLGVAADADAEALAAALARQRRRHPDAASGERLHDAWRLAHGLAEAAAARRTHLAVAGDDAPAALPPPTASDADADAVAPGGTPRAADDARPAPTEDADPGDPGAPASAAVAAALAALAAAAGRVLAPALGRALDAGADLDAALAAAPSAHRAALLASPELTWARLRRGLEARPVVVGAALLGRFAALVRDRRFAQVAAELRDERLRADGERHVEVALPAVLALTALAWPLADAGELHAAWCTLPGRLGLEPALAAAAAEVTLATRWRRALGGGQLSDSPLRPAHAVELPGALVRLVAERPLRGPAQQAELLADLARLLREPSRLLAACDHVATVDPELGVALLARLQHDAPGGPRALDQLSPARFRDLGERIVDAERQVRAPVRPWMVAAAIAAGTAAAVTAVVPVAVGAGVALGSAGLAVAQLGGARRRYVERARPLLAGVVTGAGVQSRALRAWLSFNRRLAGDLATYDIAVDTDLGLALLAAIAAVVAEHRGDDALPAGATPAALPPGAPAPSP